MEFTDRLFGNTGKVGFDNSIMFILWNTNVESWLFYSLYLKKALITHH